MVTNYQLNGDLLRPTTISPRVFKFLKRHAEGLPEHERLVVLSFNDYPFRDFVPMSKDGYNGGVKLPSHLIVPCIRFVVSKRFHFLGSLFFHSEYLTRKPDRFGKDMSECIKLYILALENINLKVIATICPLSAVFHHAVEILTHVPYMEEYDGPLVYGVGGNQEIFHIHDPKYIRDGFIRLFMLFDLEFTLNGKQFIATRFDITDVLEIANKPPLLQKAPNNSKYYNQVSYYYFNEQISLSIRKLIKQGYLGSQAIGTSIFINMFRQLFHKIYGLNDEECEIFDFSRMNEYIEFIRSIHTIQSQYSNEDYQQDVAACLSSLPPSTYEPNKELNALEKFVRETPASFLGHYTKAEHTLESINQENIYDSIMFTTASGKAFVPIDYPGATKSSKSKTKKKNKRERKKQLMNIETSDQKTYNSNTKLISSNQKGYLLPLNKSDNGEATNVPICTSGNKKLYKNKENTEIVRNTAEYQKDERQLEETICTRENERLILSPMQSSTCSKPLDPYSEILNRNIKNVDQNTSLHSNLNENIRKYKKVSKNNLGAVRKISLDDESNKENITRNVITNIPDNTVKIATDKMRNMNLSDEIREISYSISDPDDSTEYQFEQNSGTDSITQHINEIISNADDDHIEDSYNFAEGILTRETVDKLVQNYLSKEQVRNLMRADTSLENSPKFDSFVKYLKDRNLQYSAMLDEVRQPPSASQGDFVKISMKGNDRVDIERVSADSIQPPPLDRFKITPHDWRPPTSNQFDLSDVSIPTVIEKNQETGEMEVEVTTFKIKAIVTDAHGNPVDIPNNLRDRDRQSKRNCRKKDPTKSPTKRAVKISTSGIEKLSNVISDYDPLKINKNAQIIEETESINAVTFDSKEYSSNISKNEYVSEKSRTYQSEHNKLCKTVDNCQSSKLDSLASKTGDSILYDISSCNDYDVINKSDVKVTSSVKIEELFRADPKIDSNAKLNNEFPSESRVPLIKIPRINNPVGSENVKNKRYLSLQAGYSSDSEGDFEIIDRLDEDFKINNPDREQVQYGTFSKEPSEKYPLADFNSEYDEFDDMVMNKHVKMIINELEEKDEEIAEVMRKRDILESTSPSTGKDSNAKRGYIKKEIYPDGESSRTGIAKRTIFQREKTEEFAPTPPNVINSSENSCDKSKIASTKASYNETLGIKSKKQLAKIKDEQYKKVANTISQTIKRFSDIFNLPDSEEEKSTRISRASLDFVYDLKKVNEVADMKTKQELLDDSYDRLCLSILGNNAKNPNVQHKMKELMPILQEIATPKYVTHDKTADNILSKHVNETISSLHSQVEKYKGGTNRYVREDVQNLWINNIKGIEKLFKRLGSEKIYYELTPELFRTDHVEYMMNYIQTNGTRIESFTVDQRCLPLDLAECFDTLKPHGSILLMED